VALTLICTAKMMQKPSLPQKEFLEWTLKREEFAYFIYCRTTPWNSSDFFLFSYNYRKLPPNLTLNNMFLVLMAATIFQKNLYTHFIPKS
jgi:hypothetical protein